MIYKNLKKIITLKELDSIISFLKKGFKWSSKRSTSIKKSLVKHNKFLGFYGFALFNEENLIIGAILTPFQGIFRTKSIVNLSAWYVLPNFRGFNSIYMAKLITKQLRGHVITNFSPNEAALNIFRTIGFKKMKTCTSNHFLPHYLNCIFKVLFLNNNLINRVSILNDSNKGNKEVTGLLLRDSFYVNIKIQMKELKMLINKSNLEKKFGLVVISLPRLHILWSSDNSLLNRNLRLIIPFLMIKYLSPIISNHCHEIESTDRKNIWRYHLQYPEQENYVITPVGGEYSINL